MSIEITTAFAQKFASNVELKLQQRQSRLRQAVMVQSMSGVKQGQIIQQVGSVAAVKKTTRHGDTPILNTPHDARWVFPEDYHWGDLIDNADRIKTLADFDSPYADSAVSALNRAIDDEIISAMFSDTTKTGETGGTTTDWTTFYGANGGHQIASNSQGLTVGKLISAKKALRAAENDLDTDPVFCAINAELEADLLAETQVISLDYNTRPVLVDGKLTSFMGINFIHSERLLTASGAYRCPVWCKSGIGLGIWQDVNVEMAKRADKNFSLQIYASLSIGATRTQEKKIVEVLCV